MGVQRGRELGGGQRRSLADSHAVDFIKTNLTAEAAVDLLAPRLYFPQSPGVGLNMLMQSRVRSFTWLLRRSVAKRFARCSPETAVAKVNSEGPSRGR